MQGSGLFEGRGYDPQLLLDCAVSITFSEISALFGRDNNYLKLRRDEFDALPESKSSRVGWHKRMPIKTVVDMGAYLRQFSFAELTEVVGTGLSRLRLTHEDSVDMITSVCKLKQESIS